MNDLLSLFRGDDRAGSGDDYQSHGSHWTTVVAENAWPGGVESLANRPLEDGEPVDSDREGIEGYRYDDGPVGVRTVTRGGDLVTSYPVLSGCRHAFYASGLHEWETGVEAWIHGELGPASVGLFPTNFFARERDAFGGDCEVSLAAFLYDAGPREADTLSTDAGEFDVSEMAATIPIEEGAADDYHIQTVVEDVTAVDGELFEGYVLEGALYRDTDGTDVTARLFLGSHLAGAYEPAVGDSLVGSGWLQARVR